MATTITVIPAYGRDYKSKAAALADWNADKDFIVQGLAGHGQATNKADMDRLFPEDKVRIRYDKAMKVFYV
jgi:hemolysin-activating ACP:hemolysin acyltransferase